MGQLNLYQLEYTTDNYDLVPQFVPQKKWIHAANIKEAKERAKTFGEFQRGFVIKSIKRV